MYRGLNARRRRGNVSTTVPVMPLRPALLLCVCVCEREREREREGRQRLGRTDTGLDRVLPLCAHAALVTNSNDTRTPLAASAVDELPASGGREI